MTNVNPLGNSSDSKGLFNMNSHIELTDHIKSIESIIDSSIDSKRDSRNSRDSNGACRNTDSNWKIQNSNGEIVNKDSNGKNENSNMETSVKDKKHDKKVNNKKTNMDEDYIEWGEDTLV